MTIFFGIFPGLKPLTFSDLLILEIASSLSQLQKKVIVIEIGNQLMGRIIPKQIADLVQNTHIEHGNEIILNKQIEKITKKNDRA